VDSINLIINVILDSRIWNESADMTVNVALGPNESGVAIREVVELPTTQTCELKV
jgi:hypothetical protein